MRTERIPVGPAGIERAAAILRAGGLVAFPTETVYGLGARADAEAAVRKIFEAKGRPPGNPLIVHVRGAAEAAGLAAEWPSSADRLAATFWPGPLTLVLERRPGRVADAVTAGGSTVALRVPAHPIARALLEASGISIAAPSANRSTSISPTTADHVLKSLDGRIDAVLDGGPTGYGIESTILDITSLPANLLRQGAISEAEIAAVVPVIDRSGAEVSLGERARAPGMHARHYAPRARVIVAAPGEAASEARAARSKKGAVKIGALAIAASADAVELAALSEGEEPLCAWIEILPAGAPGYAAGLYAALHRLDDAGCDWLIVTAVPGEPAWAAVRDRLRRASAPAIGQ
jgi:L-threonylcarbamoyladenylate synthase